MRREPSISKGRISRDVELVVEVILLEALGSEVAGLSDILKAVGVAAALDGNKEGHQLSYRAADSVTRQRSAVYDVAAQGILEASGDIVPRVKRATGKDIRRELHRRHKRLFLVAEKQLLQIIVVDTTTAGGKIPTECPPRTTKGCRVSAGMPQKIEGLDTPFVGAEALARLKGVIPPVPNADELLKCHSRSRHLFGHHKRGRDR